MSDTAPGNSPASTPSTASNAPDPTMGGVLVAADVNEDAYLDEMMGKEPTSADNAETTPKAESVSTTEPAAKAPADESAPPSDSSSVPEVHGKTADEREAFITAKRALFRDGWSDDDLAKLSPDRIRELGTKVAKRQADIDVRMAELHKLKGGAKASPQTSGQNPLTDPYSPAGRSGDGQSIQGDKSGNPATVAQIEKLIEENVLDPDAQNSLRQALAQQATKAAEVMRQAAESQTRALLTRVDVATEQLQDQFPKLKDADEHSAILATMNRLAPAEQWADMTKAELNTLMKQACQARFGDDIAQATKQRLLTQAAKTVKGQPEAPSAPNSAKKLSAEEREDLLMDLAAQAGGDEAKYQRLRAKLDL